MRSYYDEVLAIFVLAKKGRHKQKCAAEASLAGRTKVM